MDELQVISITLHTPLEPDTTHGVKVVLNRAPLSTVEELEGAVTLAIQEVFADRDEYYPWHIKTKLHIIEPIVYVWWTEDYEERCITPRFVRNDPNNLDEVPHESVTYQMHDVGDMVHFEAEAPSTGHQDFIVKRKDETGLYGICNEDTIWIP